MSTLNAINIKHPSSLGYTPTAVGKFSVSVTATGVAGTFTTVASVSVVATQAELVL
jgi:hypothetical protein